ncbi:BacA Undecaprenyl pyrophosphate phosphatase [Candidatus Nanopelagicaceae bacterium]
MLSAIFLGIVQGLTEFLPISSNAHLAIIGKLMPSAEDPGATFVAITQIGTELAVLLYFRKDIFSIISAWLKSLKRKAHLTHHQRSDARLAWLIGIGTVPIVVLGFLGQSYIENELRSLWVIASTLIIFGFLLGFLDYMGRNERTLDQLSGGHGILYGLAQSLALIPGVSRSGATIAMGRILGYRRESALRYSFLLALPAVFGSGLYQLKKAIDEPGNQVFTMPETLAATFVAFLVGYAVIAWLMRYISTKSFTPFVIYRIVLGTALLIALATGAISA